MVKKTYTPEQIINKLREAEVLLNQGATIGEASRKIGVTAQKRGSHSLLSARAPVINIL